MNKVLAVGLFAISIVIFHACTPNRGCTEQTADNYDQAADEDDGTCIPSRDKLIGTYAYTNVWTDVVSGMDTLAQGTIQVTEANTGINAFNMNFDGNMFLQGVITQNNIVFENHLTATESYTGTGIWLDGDTIDAVLNITYTNVLLPAPQPFVYYCKKSQ